MNTTRIVLAALMIFAAGVLTGGVGAGLAGRILRERPRREVSPARVEPGPMIPSALISQAAGSSNQSAGTPVKGPGNAQLEAMTRWTRELDLEGDQRERIQVILKGAQVRLRDLWAPMAPRARGEIESARIEIEALLSASQRQRWDEVRRRRAGAKTAVPAPENPHP
ncbi:MAG: hypothetical protein NTX70_12930 [Verrucomicrobia bacterium]|nr:hypothetical protein [Verrucomicrobiota bacterium]